MRLLIGLVTMLLLLALPAQAASYDCGKAAGPDEVAVCRDGTLSALDSEMAGLLFTYDKLPMVPAAGTTRTSDAEAFAESRRGCGPDITCLRRVYTARIAMLQQGIEASIKTYSDLQNGLPPLTADLPEGVENLVSAFAAQCERLGGRLTSAASRPAILSGDLDGDKVPDYLVNTQPLACTNSATAFCGNAGCQVQIALSTNRFDDPIDLQGGKPMLVQDTTGTVARLAVQRSNCPDAPANSTCWATYSWPGGKPSVSYATGSPTM